MERGCRACYPRLPERLGVRAIGDGTLLQTGSTIQILNAVRIGDSEIVAPKVGTSRVRESFID